MEVKVYNTRQKTIILEMLKNNKNKHLTADDMLFILSAQKVSVSRATLYRYLDVLVSTGDVKKYILSESDKACYQYVDSGKSCNEHFHRMTKFPQLHHYHYTIFCFQVHADNLH